MSVEVGTLLGMKVIQSAMVPLERKPGPMAVFRSKGHPLVYWLSRQLARVGITLEPDMLTPYQTWIDAPRIFMVGDTILVHPSHYEAVVAAIGATTPGRSVG